MNTFSFPSSAYIGDDITFNFEKDENIGCVTITFLYNHTVIRSINNNIHLYEEDSYTWTIPEELIDIGNYTNSDSDNNFVISIYFFEDDGRIAYHSSNNNINLILPKSYVPTIDNVTYSFYIDGYNFAKPIIDKSTLNISSDITPSEGAEGVNNVSITVGNVTNSYIPTDITNAHGFYNGILRTANSTDTTFDITITATDTRGRTATYTETKTCYPYQKPSGTARIYRSSVSGTEDEQGAYVTIQIDNYTFSELGGENLIRLRILKNALSESSEYLIDETLASFTGENLIYTFPFGANESTRWIVRLVDYMGLIDIANTYIDMVESFINFNIEGNGIGIGATADIENSVIVNYDAYFNGAVKINGSDLIDVIYPIGSIYMSTNSVSPQTFLGGTWEQIQDTFLLAAGSTYEAGSSGGEAEHTLSVSEMPSHRHDMKEIWSSGSGSSSAYVMESSRKLQTRYTSYTGSTKAHNNMPPYLTVYIWKRTA